MNSEVYLIPNKISLLIESNNNMDGFTLQTEKIKIPLSLPFPEYTGSEEQKKELFEEVSRKSPIIIPHLSNIINKLAKVLDEAKGIYENYDDIPLAEDDSVPPISFDGLHEYNLVKQFVNHIAA